MKTLIAIGLALAACTQQEPQQPAAAPLTPEQMAPPRESGVSALSGVVTSTKPGEVALDSGGAQPIELRIAPSAQVVRDGQQAGVDEIREGDVVRAAVRMSDQGEPLALHVVVNSRPVTGRATPPQAAAPAAAGPARAR